jgi:hypothetical protein
MQADKEKLLALVKQLQDTLKAAKQEAETKKVGSESICIFSSHIHSHHSIHN